MSFSKKKRMALLLAAVVLACTLTGCHEADKVNHNMNVAADVAEVVLARWEETGWREYDAQIGVTICYPKLAIVCTNCRCAFKKDALWKRNFCPGCGAKMDGGSNGE